MHNYPPLDDNVAAMSENDTPIVVSDEELLSQRIRPGKSSGPDNLPNWVLKTFADLLVAPVTVILNASFREEQLPAVWKLANVYVPSLKARLCWMLIIHRWTETVDERGGTVRALLRQRVKLHSILFYFIL
jgi:hypothetical protein